MTKPFSTLRDAMSPQQKKAAAEKVEHWLEGIDAMRGLHGENQLLRAENAELREALHMAVQHLDWIGWGDSYERECVRDSGEMAKINDALAKHKEQDDA